ncbi:MAG TPA: stage VI sporulation protein F [Paenibacillaceae bacterium]
MDDWRKYGISPARMARVREKMKHPAVKERLKAMTAGLTKQDLQDRARVRSLVRSVSRILKEPLTPDEEDLLVDYVLAQRIDPRNKLHLLRLWAMFR